MSRDELLWDHAGEDLDNPLLGKYDEDESDEHIKLSQYEALHLINQLEKTSALLKTYLTENEMNYEQPKSDPEKSKKKTWFSTKCEKLLNYTTGFRIIVFTIVLQGINLIIQTLMDIWPKKDDYTALIVSGTTMILLQVFNLVIIIFSSVKLVKQFFHKHISGMLLGQSYVAAILLFAGIYTLTKRLKPTSWKDVREDIGKDPDLLLVMYCKFLYFSVSTSTLCGTAEVAPNDWFNYIFVSSQMLLSFMYFASIMGNVLNPFPVAHAQPVFPHPSPGKSSIQGPMYRRRVSSRGSTPSFSRLSNTNNSADERTPILSHSLENT